MKKIKSGYNPAAWMLEVTSSSEENRLGVDFAEIYRRSNLFQYGHYLENFLLVFPLWKTTTIFFLLSALSDLSFFCCYRRNKELVESLSRPSSNAKELNFPTKYSRSFLEQFLACLWKQKLSYWRNPQYTAVRFFYTVVISLMLGTICWKFGSKRSFCCELFSNFKYLLCTFC